MRGGEGGGGGNRKAKPAYSFEHLLVLLKPVLGVPPRCESIFSTKTEQLTEFGLALLLFRLVWLHARVARRLGIPVIFLNCPTALGAKLRVCSVLVAEGDLKPINGIETSLQMRTARNSQLGDFPLQVGQFLGDVYSVGIGGSLRNGLAVVQLAEETLDLSVTVTQLGGINLAASLSLTVGLFELDLRVPELVSQLPTNFIGIVKLSAGFVVSSSVVVQLTFQLSNSDGQELLSCQVRRCHVGQGFLLAALIKRGRSGRELLTASAYVADAQDGSDQQRTHRNENAAENHLVHGDQ
ncbi:hypothetical protein N7488_003524 [Penicillium malachiteum]|nr:hypothetical protein N7488_003524 [Penicillium malachiteum]